MTSTPSVIRSLKKQANSRNVEGMARFGISSTNTLGVSMPVIRAMGKRIGRDHDLAAELWTSGIHEARILAGLVDEPAHVTSAQMDRWAKDFDSWDVCDQVCLNLFSQTRFAHSKALEWSTAKREFVKRAVFALMPKFKPLRLILPPLTADDFAGLRTMICRSDAHCGGCGNGEPSWN